MAQKCNCCNHKARREIDRQIVMGIAISQISREFGISEDSIRNHRENNHISRQMVKAVEIKQQEHGINVLSELDDLMNRTKSILKTAEDKKRNGLALQAIRELRGNLELISKIQAFIIQQQQKREEIEQSNTVEIQNSEFDENLENLDPIEKEVYFSLLFKLMHGGTDQINGIRYQTNGITHSNTEVIHTPHSGDKTPYSPSFQRTRKPRRSEPEQDTDDQPRVRPITGTPIEYTKHPRRGIDI